MYAKLDLNLQPVKSTYHLGPKTYSINIATLRVVKNLFKRAINIFVCMFFLEIYLHTYTRFLAKYLHHMSLQLRTTKYFFQRNEISKELSNQSKCGYLQLDFLLSTNYLLYFKQIHFLSWDISLNLAPIQNNNLSKEKLEKL